MKKYCITLAALAASIPLVAQQPPSPAAVATSAAGSSVQAATAPAVGNRRRAPARPKGPTPHLADGTVDLSGVWNGGGPIGDVSQGLPKGEKLEMTPWAEKVFKSRKSKDDPEANCLPTGVPRISPYPWRIVQTPTHVFILFEGNIHSYRQIFVDGRKHPDDPDPTWYGNSIGHYEGNSLIIDTTGYNDKFWFDFNGHPHTEQLHTIEKYTRTDLGTLEVETQVIDPGAYVKPFTLHFTASLRPKEELMEYICQENQVDAQHLVGGAGLN
ncbi:MAG TPA: hypothetical protein VHU90_12125 [Galbitalea sp.]|nr:hypothetical protein [Galbitalea sp.]